MIRPDTIVLKQTMELPLFAILQRTPKVAVTLAFVLFLFTIVYAFYILSWPIQSYLHQSHHPRLTIPLQPLIQTSSDYTLTSMTPSGQVSLTSLTTWLYHPATGFTGRLFFMKTNKSLGASTVRYQKRVNCFGLWIQEGFKNISKGFTRKFQGFGIFAEFFSSKFRRWPLERRRGLCRDTTLQTKRNNFRRCGSQGSRHSTGGI